MSAPIKVLHILGRLHRAGAELRTVDIVRHLAPSGRFRCDFLSLSGLRGELDADVRSLGGTVHYLALAPSFPRAFAALLRRERYQVVHSHVHLFSGYILRAAAAAGVPVRVAHWRNTSDGRGRGARRQVQRWVFRRWIDRYATDILAVGQGAMIAAWSERWHEDVRCRVVPNGIDLRSFQVPVDQRAVRAAFGFGPEHLLIVHVGRCDPAKNHLGLLDAFHAVATQRSDARLLLVGREDTQHAAVVRARAGALGLEPRIVWAGVRRDVPAILVAADVMAFPSLWEGMPGAVLEAAAAGLPTVASALPGTVEIAEAAPLLRCLPLPVSPADWAAAIGAQAAMDQRQRMAAAAAFADSPFRVEAAATAIADVWERAERRPCGAAA